MSSKPSRRKRSKRPYQPDPAPERISSAVAADPQAAPSAPAEVGTAGIRPERVTSPAATVARNPYISGDLRRIGIIAVIMIAVLVVLSRVL